MFTITTTASHTCTCCCQGQQTTASHTCTCCCQGQQTTASHTCTGCCQGQQTTASHICTRCCQGQQTTASHTCTRCCQDNKLQHHTPAHVVVKYNNFTTGLRSSYLPNNFFWNSPELPFPFESFIHKWNF